MLAYDSDDPAPRSPGLQPVEVRFSPPNSPSRSRHRRKPMSPSESPPQPEASEGRKRKRAKKHKPSQGDVVLWTTSFPNRPDIARETGQRALLSNSEGNQSSDDSDSDQDPAMSERDGPPAAARIMPRHDPRGRQVQSPGRDGAALEMRSSPIKDNSLRRQSSHNTEILGATHLSSRQNSTNTLYAEPMELREADNAVSFDYGHLRRSTIGNSERRRGVTALRDPSSVETGRWAPHASQDSTSISASPSLRPYILSAAQGSPGHTLAAYQMDSPSTILGSVSSPGHEQSLPPVSRLFQVADANPENAAQMYRTRTGSISSVHSSVASAPTPSLPYFNPSANISLASPDAYLGRSHTDPSIIGPPLSRYTSTTSYSFPQRSPTQQSEVKFDVIPPPFSRSSTSATSPPGPMPSPQTTVPTESQHTPGKQNRNIRSSIGSGAESGPHGPIEYRCTHPDCQAPPFQTQYLLK